MARRSKVVFCLLLAFLYVVVNICPLRAEALPDVMSGGTTLADNIMSYYALTGCAVANEDWINTLYSSYGTSFGTIEELAQQGYLVLNDAGNWEPVQELTQAIEQAPAYASLELNEMFKVSAEEAAAGGGLVAASGGSILAGSLGGVASTGVLPLLGGVTVAYWGGIGIGTLAAHALGLYGKKISVGASITTAQNILNQMDPGSTIGYFCWTGGTNYGKLTGETNVAPPDGWIVYVVDTSLSGFYQMQLCNPTTSQLRFLFINKTGTVSNVNVNAKNTTARGKTVYPNGLTLTSEQWETYRTTITNGTATKPSIKSPDIIGSEGNQVGTYSNQEYQVPEVKPQIDPGTQAGKPLTKEDWLQFANGVKNNNNSSDPVENNKDLFQDIIRNIVPDLNPNPIPDPWTPPVVTPVPDPSYPDPVPDQQITENPQESENPQQTEPLDPNDTGKPWKLPDFRQKFPFCIPWDIKDCFTLLKSNIRQAPHISWRFNPPNTPIDYTFNLDLSDFDPVATLLRTLELIAFIVGLAFATRYLIGAS